MFDKPPCPDCRQSSEVLSCVGDRWSVLVVFSLSRHGKTRFNELKRSLGISQRMLSVTLKKLKRDGLVSRKQYETIPPKVEYELTAMGQSFQGPVSELGSWAMKNVAAISASRSAYDQSSTS